MNTVYVVGAARSPIFSVELGKNGGLNTSSVSGLLPQEIGAQVLAELFTERFLIDPKDVDFFYLGSAISQKVERNLFQAPAKFVFRKGAAGPVGKALGRTGEKGASTSLS